MSVRAHVQNPKPRHRGSHRNRGGRQRGDVRPARAVARRAFEGPWRTVRASERGQILLRLVDLMKKHADEIAALESLDAGKPISGILRQDFPAAVDTLTYYAGWADKISGEIVSTRNDALTYTMREPVGVVAVIVPWNFPLMIGMWKLAPALACGCTIVMKPAELTSLSPLRLGGGAPEGGVAPGGRKGAACGIFFNRGAVCSAGSRVLAHEKVYDEVVDRLTQRAKAIRMGDPADRTTALGPVISEKQMKSILDYVDIGQNEGALLTTGGKRIGDHGSFISPAVFADVKHEMRISQEEIFGPVVSVIKFRDEADAVRIANGTAYSLAAGVW